MPRRRLATLACDLRRVSACFAALRNVRQRTSRTRSTTHRSELSGSSASRLPREPAVRSTHDAPTNGRVRRTRSTHRIVMVRYCQRISGASRDSTLHRASHALVRRMAWSGSYNCRALGRLRRPRPYGALAATDHRARCRRKLRHRLRVAAALVDVLFRSRGAVCGRARIMVHRGLRSRRQELEAAIPVLARRGSMAPRVAPGARRTTCRPLINLDQSCGKTETLAAGIAALYETTIPTPPAH